jgi:nitrate reductase alpha subunit
MNTIPNPTTKALDIVCREFVDIFNKCVQIGPQAKTNRMNQAVPMGMKRQWQHGPVSSQDVTSFENRPEQSQ